MPEGMLTFGQILLREINAMAAKSVPANEIEKIRVRAVEFIRTAADANLLDAQTQYGKLLVEGNLVTANCAVGVDYLDVAASRGSLYAMLLLGEVQWQGFGPLKCFSISPLSIAALKSFLLIVFLLVFNRIFI
jgi:TPR repeat protein